VSDGLVDEGGEVGVGVIGDGGAGRHGGAHNGAGDGADGCRARARWTGSGEPVPGLKVLILRDYPAQPTAAADRISLGATLPGARRSRAAWFAIF
jgi:hypothetical protein